MARGRQGRIGSLAGCLLAVGVLVSCGDDGTVAESGDAARRTDIEDRSSTTDPDVGVGGPTATRDEPTGQGDADEAGDSEASTTVGSSAGTSRSELDEGGSVDADDAEGPHATDGGEEGSTDRRSSDAEEVSYSDLQARPDAYVGRTVEVVGRVHFDTRCPPPEQGGGGPCTLVGHLTHESVTHMGPADVREAFLLVRDGASVSCVDTDGTGTCPGWEKGERYRIVAEVQRQVRGGRETDDIELEVIEKSIH